jgi:hypothetical protein
MQAYGAPPEALHTAIMTESYALVRELLTKTGGARASDPIAVVAKLDKTKTKPSSTVLWHDPDAPATARCPPLHFMLCHIVHHRLACRSTDTSLEIINVLLASEIRGLARSASVTRAAPVCVSTATDFYGYGCDPKVLDVHALDLAVHFKLLARGAGTGADRLLLAATDLDLVIQKLLAAKNEAAWGSLAGPQLPTRPVAEAASQTWARLFEDETFADVKIVCSDGVLVRAHKCVLAAASERFQTLLVTKQLAMPGTHSTDMVAILRYVYTGELPPVERREFELLDVAAEFGLAALEQLCIGHLERALSPARVREVLLWAERRQHARLRAAVHSFVRANAAAVLTRQAI